MLRIDADGADLLDELPAGVVEFGGSGQIVASLGGAGLGQVVTKSQLAGFAADAFFDRGLCVCDLRAG